MIIQCPACKSRYRSKPLPETVKTAQVKCPKCNQQFQVSQEPADENVVDSNKQTILVVDDARFFRELLLDLLEGRDANMLTADSATEALNSLEQKKVDLLIVDINLPDKNGLDLIRELRAEERFSNLKILCISGVYRKDDDARKALHAGADDFISKSFKPEELNARIDKLLK
ncbi:MJ0042 family finger-like domain-containing protein [Malonomonas rubra DSM 5091]|uniref:MJ0042 family finger-like domain-containing protein n=1 Tax=Malonomonas rubra DSM 5091 TaxID=1122189 RepID=A0A1M6DJJ1_MALRU|nr:response regulator [Malonomonas rubra]SHI73517.1 MJ0042 family finger-like domain-containing protein [Malonomonas rubra DSM 5091]